MNPDTGKLHEMATIEGIERIAKGENVEGAEALLAKAQKKFDDLKAKSSEPEPGTEVPKDWPRFQVGEKIGPIKGWWFELVDVDIESQEMLIKPLEPTKGTTARRTGKPRKRKKVRR